MKMQVRKNQVPGGGGKMQVRKKQVQMCTDEKSKYGKMKLARASTDGATIDGLRCETDITKHPNKHVNLINNLKVGLRDWGGR